MSPSRTWLSRVPRLWYTLIASVAGQSPYWAGVWVIAGVVLLSRAAHDLGLNRSGDTTVTRAGSYALVLRDGQPAGYAIGTLALLILGIGGAALWRWRSGVMTQLPDREAQRSGGL